MLGLQLESSGCSSSLVVVTMVVGDLVGIPVLRQASRQLPDKAVQALLFLLLLLLFLDPRNSEQAVAGLLHC